ncbi:MAG: alpha/beta fold hydrolase [Chloroflexota bacterium]
MANQHDLTVPDRRRLVYYDTGPTEAADELTLVWHHGSPQTGTLLEPLVTAAATRRIRLISYARPAYGGSTRLPGRDVASAAGDVAQVADALAIDRFAVMGASGGGPHALACAALLGERVVGVVSLAGIAPYSDRFDWFAGMVAPSGLRAAVNGREARERHALTDEFDENSFTTSDWATLAGPWASLGRDAGEAAAAGSDGLVDDDVAFVSSWGFDVAAITAPVLIVQGGEDRVVPALHADSLVRSIPTAELWLRPRDGHISVLNACPVGMDWLRSIGRPD